MRLWSLPLGLCLLFALVGSASATSWASVRDPAGRYVIELPTTSFEAVATGETGHLTWNEVGGGAIIDVYSGRNLKHLAANDFIHELSRAPRIADVTYAARGRTWFAISGHYLREKADDVPLIYYAKFVFSSDLSRFAAFEISYPVAEKVRLDDIVTHLEKTLRLLGT